MPHWGSYSQDTELDAATLFQMVKDGYEDESHVFRKAANDITSQLEINFGNLPRPGRGARGGTRGGRGRIRRAENYGPRAEVVVSSCVGNLGRAAERGPWAMPASPDVTWEERQALQLLPPPASVSDSGPSVRYRPFCSRETHCLL